MSTVTLKDVAAKAGVSYQTVSKVLNHKAQVAPETEARIWRAVRELNYRPNVAAQNLRTQASHLLGYAWRHVYTSWRPILNSFLYSVIDAAEARGYLTLFFTDRNGSTAANPTTSYAELYARKQVDGFILADVVRDDPRVAFLIEENIPFTSFGRANEEWDHCWVDVDGIAGIEAVMGHLQEQGHRRIAFITLTDASQMAQHRCEGYLRGLKKAGITPDPDWIVYGENTTQTGAEGVTRLLALAPRRRPSAVVCVTDQIAVGAMNAAIEAGLQVGRDIAITGYDDMPPAAHLQPPLTTVRQPVHQVGQHIVELLLKQINNEVIEQKGILLTPELVIRKSS
jgi:DNA-binding LacI/PurR family transcriptional regulator